MTALVGPAGTGKTQTVMSLIAGTYYMLAGGLDSALAMESLKRRWMDDKKRRRRNTSMDSANTVRRAQLPKIPLTALTNKAVSVLEELTQESVAVFDETTNRSVTIVPIYLHLDQNTTHYFAPVYVRPWIT